MAATAKLTGPQLQQLVTALTDAYDTPSLARMLRFRLDKRLDFISGDDFLDKVFNLVTAAEREGWTLRLIVAARASNPGNAALVVCEETLGLAVTQPQDTGVLEKIVKDLASFVDVAQFRSRLGMLETCVCAIEHPAGFGTGFLVAPDLVLTNYHVIEPLLDNTVSPQSVHCRFDFKALPGAGAVVSQGRLVSLAAEWKVATSRYSNFDLTDAPPDPTAAELDFAVIRLAEPVGTQPIGDRAEVGAPKRGWVTLASAPPAVAATQDLLVLQHPQDIAAAVTKPMPMQLAFGTVKGFAGGGRRLRHDTKTLPGSSGSPCFNAKLELVALHHAGDPKSQLQFKGQFNQAIPIELVTKHLQGLQVTPFWDKEPG